MGEVRSIYSETISKWGILPKEKMDIKFISCGVELIWPHLNSSCSNADSLTI